MTLVYLCETHSGMSTRWEQCGPEDMGATAFVEEGSGVRVRKLGWEKHPIMEAWRCDTMIGTYKVFAVTQPVTWDFDGLDDEGIGLSTSKVAQNIKAAKAAAQADYEARILAALEPTPPAVQEQTDGGRG